MRRIAGVIVLVGAAALAGCGGSSDKDAVTQTTSTNARNASETTVGDRTTAAQTTTTRVLEKGDLAVESGFASQVNSIGTRETTAGAVVKNPRKVASACEVSVTFNLKDASGTVIDTTTETVGRIGPGERALVAPLQVGFDAPSEPKVLQVTTIVDHYAETKDLAGCQTFSVSSGVPLQVVSASIKRGEFSSGVTGQVKNPTKTVVKTPSVDCILFAGTTIVGGISTSIMDPIPPGGTIAFDAGSLGFVPASATSTECQIVA